LTCV